MKTDKTYEQLSKLVRKTAAELTKALDKLEAARTGNDPGKVPGLHNDAHKAMSRHDDALNDLEKARQLYWLARAKDAEAKLMELAPGLVDQVVTYRKAACVSGIPTCPVDLLRQVLQVNRAPFNIADTIVPDGTYNCPILNRADEDICFNQRAISRQIVDRDRTAARG